MNTLDINLNDTVKLRSRITTISKATDVTIISVMVNGEPKLFVYKGNKPIDQYINKDVDVEFARNPFSNIESKRTMLNSVAVININ